MITVILGPPGTGKTTTLLNILKQQLSAGTKPEEIGYISFTTKAVKETTSRLNEQSERVFYPWFRTLHSLAFTCLGLGRESVMNKAHYSKLCETLGIDYSGFINMQEGMIMPGGHQGDRMLFSEGVARSLGRSLEEQYNKRDEDYSLAEFKRFKLALEAYKTSQFMLDFNDMLQDAIDAPDCLPRFKCLFVDEAQDLSTLQWALVKLLIARSETTYIAGDDDQAIFSWAGADVRTFIDTAKTSKTKILDKSYRLPAAVHEVSERIISRLQRRVSKHFTPKSEIGVVKYSDISNIDLSHGQWLILARNRYLLAEAERECLEAGYPYSGASSPMDTKQGQAIRAYENLRAGQTITDKEAALIKQFGAPINSLGPIWHETFPRIGRQTKQYFIQCLKRKESILRAPRIVLSTIHGAKGGEATNVALLTDMSYASYEEMQNDPDNETRVFYVGATRAKENLYIVEPKTNLYFDI